MTGTAHAAGAAGGRVLVPRPGAAVCGEELVSCFLALEEAGQYERAGALRGGTAWDMARALAPGAIFLPECRREAIVRDGGRGTSEFPGWDARVVTTLVLAVARDPDRITWDDPAAWPGTEIAGPCWRAEGTAGGLAITVALSGDGEITGARVAPRPGSTSTMRVPSAAAAQPGSNTWQRGRTRA